MKFPETTREGTAAHRSAVDRLDAARHERDRRQDDYDGAQEGRAQVNAAGDLATANEQLAAREAWVGWIERGY